MHVPQHEQADPRQRRSIAFLISELRLSLSCCCGSCSRLVIDLLRVACLLNNALLMIDC